MANRFVSASQSGQGRVAPLEWIARFVRPEAFVEAKSDDGRKISDTKVYIGENTFGYAAPHTAAMVLTNPRRVFDEKQGADGHAAGFHVTVRQRLVDLVDGCIASEVEDDRYYGVIRDGNYQMPIQIPRIDVLRPLVGYRDIVVPLMPARLQYACDECGGEPKHYREWLKDHEYCMACGKHVSCKGLTVLRQCALEMETLGQRGKLHNTPMVAVMYMTILQCLLIQICELHRPTGLTADEVTRRRMFMEHFLYALHALRYYVRELDEIRNVLEPLVYDASAMDSLQRVLAHLVLNKPVSQETWMELLEMIVHRSLKFQHEQQQHIDLVKQLNPGYLAMFVMIPVVTRMEVGRWEVDALDLTDMVNDGRVSEFASDILTEYDQTVVRVLRAAKDLPPLESAPKADVAYIGAERKEGVDPDAVDVRPVAVARAAQAPAAQAAEAIDVPHRNERADGKHEHEKEGWVTITYGAYGRRRKTIHVADRDKRRHDPKAAVAQRRRRVGATVVRNARYLQALVEVGASAVAYDTDEYAALIEFVNRREYQSGSLEFSRQRIEAIAQDRLRVVEAADHGAFRLLVSGLTEQATMVRLPRVSVHYTAAKYSPQAQFVLVPHLVVMPTEFRRWSCVALDTSGLYRVECHILGNATPARGRSNDQHNVAVVRFTGGKELFPANVSGRSSAGVDYSRPSPLEMYEYRYTGTHLSLKEPFYVHVQDTQYKVLTSDRQTVFFQQRFTQHVPVLIGFKCVSIDISRVVV